MVVTAALRHSGKQRFQLLVIQLVVGSWVKTLTQGEPLEKAKHKDMYARHFQFSRGTSDRRNSADKVR